MGQETDRRVVEVLGADEDVAAALGRMGIELGRPVLVLFGGADGVEDEASDRLYPIVRDGVVAVAVRCGAAIVDGGTLSGVMALAGRARADLSAEVPLVGVAPAGKVTARGVQDATGSTRLDPNHSHHLLAPGEAWGDESQTLLNTAEAIANGKPVVAVIVDGGAIALNESLEATNRGWPLVAVAGSGRSADLISAFDRGRATPSIAADRSSIHVIDFNDGPEALATKLASLLGGGAHAPSAEPAGPTQPGEPTGPAALVDGGPIEYPALYLSAAEASRRGQGHVRRLAWVEIGSTILGIGAASLLKFLPINDVSALTAAAAAMPLLVAPIIKFVSFSSGFDRDWYGGRAVAEKVKSLAWCYMMRASPYDVPNSDEQFTRDLADVQRQRPDIRQALDRLPARPFQITPQMRSIRARGLAARSDVYLNTRLIDQADWYRRKSAENRKKATAWFWLSLALQVGAAAAAILAITDISGSRDMWLGFVTTLGAASLAGTALTQLNRYDETAKSYAIALQEVLLVADLARPFEDEAHLSRFVASGEDAIGRERQLWMAKRSSSDASH